MTNDCLNTSCGTITSKPLMTLIDQCFTVSDCDKISAQFCLNEFAFPVDGHKCFSLEVPKSIQGALDESIVIFDNEIIITSSPSSPIQELDKEKPYARGVLLYIDYQKEDSNGEEVELQDKKAWITITNANDEECTYPIYNFFSIFTNPSTLDPSDFINKIKVTNPSDNHSLYVKSLVVFTKTETL